MQRVRMALRRLVKGVDERGINVRLLKKVARYIREHPEHYDQATWFRFNDDGRVTLDSVTPAQVQEHLIPGNGPTCGTVACVAGTALWMSRRFDEFLLDTFDEKGPLYVDWQTGAATVLGLPDEATNWLFSAIRDEKTMPQLLEAIAKGHSVETDALLELEDGLLAERGLYRDYSTEEIRDLESMDA